MMLDCKVTEILVAMVYANCSEQTNLLVTWCCIARQLTHHYRSKLLLDQG
jgi:hypothetical protein